MKTILNLKTIRVMPSMQKKYLKAEAQIDWSQSAENIQSVKK